MAGPLEYVLYPELELGAVLMLEEDLLQNQS
jgi:hypothetical protein